jgi:hypothetical protein
MKKHFITALLLLSTLGIYAQEILMETDISLMSGRNFLRESIPIVNEKDKQLALFIFDNKGVNALLIDDSCKIIDSCYTLRPKRKYSELLGSSVMNGNYNLFFSNGKKTKFLVQTVNFETNKRSLKPIDLILTGEEYLESVSDNNNFYLITIKPYSSILKFYVFEDNTLTKCEEINLTKYYRGLEAALEECTGIFKCFLSIQKIDNHCPNPLELVSQNNKLYCNDGIMYITLDKSPKSTQVICINLEDFSFDAKHYNLANNDGSRTMNQIKSNSNSYLSDGFLYQIRAWRNELHFSIYNLQSDSIVKKYSVKTGQEITINNTPFILKRTSDNVPDGMEKELNGTEQVLRKISSNEIGISAYKLGGNLEITLGSYKEVKSNPGMMMPMPGVGFVAGGISIGMTFNPAMMGYNAYTRTKSVYFKSLWDPNSFEHNEGSISENAFDKIHNFSKPIINNIASETIFKLKGYFVYGYYSFKDKKYFLRKFTD